MAAFTLLGEDSNRKDRQLSGRTARRRVLRLTVPAEGKPGGATARADLLAAEEPLGIRADGAALAMTMRTPGDDIELAAGFLVSEAIVRSPGDIVEIKLCDGTSCGHGNHDGLGNVADVSLAPGVAITSAARRNFMITSACGVCGKTSIEDICVLPQAALSADETTFSPQVLAKLGEPYVTSRPGAEGSRTGHIGMGLGFFIAKTLLERSGAIVKTENRVPPATGAVVTILWERAVFERGAKRLPASGTAAKPGAEHRPRS